MSEKKDSFHEDLFFVVRGMHRLDYTTEKFRDEVTKNFETYTHTEDRWVEYHWEDRLWV